MVKLPTVAMPTQSASLQRMRMKHLCYSPGCEACPHPLGICSGHSLNNISCQLATAPPHVIVPFRSCTLEGVTFGPVHPGELGRPQDWSVLSPRHVCSSTYVTKNTATESDKAPARLLALDKLSTIPDKPGTRASRLKRLTPKGRGDGATTCRAEPRVPIVMPQAATVGVHAAALLLGHAGIPCVVRRATGQERACCSPEPSIAGHGFR